MQRKKKGRAGTATTPAIPGFAGLAEIGAPHVVQRKTLHPRRQARRKLGEEKRAGLHYVTSVATADKYDMEGLHKYFQPKMVDEDVAMLHLSAYDGNEETWVFFFPYGVAVWWGSEDIGQRVLGQLAPFETRPETKRQFETCEFVTTSAAHELLGLTATSSSSMLLPPRFTRNHSHDGDKHPAQHSPPSRFPAATAGQHPVIYMDRIFLFDDSVELKLGISHAIAQSCKLTVYEERIDQVIKETREYPEVLAQRGAVPLSRAEAARLKGQLFVHRMSINLHSDILDTPDFVWEHTALDPAYRAVRKDMDIDQRVNVLNQRLQIVNELFEALHQDLHNKHSSNLEWIVIWLIVVELVLGLVAIVQEYVL